MTITHKSLIDHIEQYLGKIQHGWNKTFEGTKMDPQIVECRGRIDLTCSFCTLGLSKHHLSPKALNGLPIRQELLIMTFENFRAQNIPTLLQQLASDVMRQHRAFLCGDIIERVNPIFPKKPFFAFWAISPTVLPDEFATYIDENGNETVFVWMVPITRSEAAFARKNGWSKLEDIFIAQSADLIDFDRKSII